MQNTKRKPYKIDFFSHEKIKSEIFNYLHNYIYHHKRLNYENIKISSCDCSIANCIFCR